jgi:hypothetical protein
MDLELSGRCEKDRLVIEDGRATLQSGPVSQVFVKSKTTFALVFIIPLHLLFVSRPILTHWYYESRSFEVINGSM